VENTGYVKGGTSNDAAVVLPLAVVSRIIRVVVEYRSHCTNKALKSLFMHINNSTLYVGDPVTLSKTLQPTSIDKRVSAERVGAATRKALEENTVWQVVDLGLVVRLKVK